jgi:metal-responsive CopG/Arc/MetJ family transcriptional regulator
MSEYRSVRARLEKVLLNEVDTYRTRYRSRTEIIDAALRQYLPELAKHDKQAAISADASSLNWRENL